MARKPALSKKEDIEAVPLDREIVIDAGAEDPVVTIERDEEPEKKEPPQKAPPVQMEEPEEVADLKKQLAALQQAEENSRSLLEQRQRDLEEANRRARELEERNTAAAANELELQLDSVLNAINAAESEAASAQQAFQQAAMNGEYQAQAEAQLKMSRAAARLESLESGKNALEMRLEQAKKAPPPTQKTESPVDPFEANIANLPDPAKTWLRGHREYMMDTRKNAKIQAAHWDVLDEGHKAYSPDYFESLEVKLGLRQAKTEDDDPPPETRSRTVSAPVTREVPSPTTGRPTSNRVTLSAEEREIARSSMPHLAPGEAERLYAQNKLKLNGLKAAGHYRES